MQPHITASKPRDSVQTLRRPRARRGVQTFGNDLTLISKASPHRARTDLLDGMQLLKFTAHVVQKRRLDLPLKASAGEQEGEDIDFAVLRMTLGIPGFDETQLPRVVALLCVFLIAANRQASGGDVTQAQVGAETIGAVLAAACVALPLLGKRLADAQAGRSQATQSLDGLQGTQLFAIEPSLAEGTRQELAWASYTLLRNTGSCSVIIASPEQAWLARGMFEGVSSSSLAALPEISQGVQEAVQNALRQSTDLSTQSSIYLPDRGALSKAGASGWSFLPAAAQTVLLQRLQPYSKTDISSDRIEGQAGSLRTGAGSSSSSAQVREATGRSKVGDDGGAMDRWVILVSATPRALSRRERQWTAAVAAKLAAALPH